jgi:fumarate hydratase subunit alpha
VVGVGIGGDADLCIQLGKQALLRNLGHRHSIPAIARLEETILQRCNEQGVGPMGLGGNTTVMDVHLELTEHHPAMIPVAVVMSCWALRRAHMTIHEDGSWEVE